MTAFSTSISGTRPTTNGRSPSCSRRPCTRTRCSSAGRARTGPRRSIRLEPFSPSTRRPASLKWTFEALAAGTRQQRPARRMSGPSMSIDQERGISISAGLLRRVRISSAAIARKPLPLATSVTALDAETGKVRVEPPDRPSRSSGTTTPTRRRFWWISRRTARPFRRWCSRARWASSSSSTALTGEPIFPIEERTVPQSDVPGEQSSPTQPYVRSAEPAVPDRLPGISTLADIASFGHCSRDLQEHALRRPLYPAKPAGHYRLSSHRRRRGMGRRRGRSAHRHLCRQQFQRRADLQAADRAPTTTRPKTPQRSETGGYFPQTARPMAFSCTTSSIPSACRAGIRPTARCRPTISRPASCCGRSLSAQVQQWGFYMPKSWGSVTIGGPVITNRPHLHRRFDGFARAGDRSQDRRCAVAGVGRRAGRRHPGDVHLQGQAYVVFVAGGNAILKPQASDQVAAFALK